MIGCARSFRLKGHLETSLRSKLQSCTWTRRNDRAGAECCCSCTHHKTLSFAKGFFSWPVESKYIRETPFAKVKALGLAQSEKRQLPEDEAHKLCALAIVLA